MPKGKACPSAYPTRVNTLCEHIVKTTRTEWEVKFFFIVLVAACILYFALRRKRAGVATFAVFLGLGLGLGSGLVFFFMGAWLIMRAYRLQKYGSRHHDGFQSGGERDGSGSKRRTRTRHRAIHGSVGHVRLADATD